jgi:diguanylate cyclase (GGDEF)-like protein
MKGILTGAMPALAPELTAERTDEIRVLLAERPLLLPIAEDLRASFQHWRLRDLPRYIRLASLPLVMLAMLLTVLSARFFDGELNATDTLLWTAGSLSVCTALIISVALAQLPAVQRRYAWLAMPAGALLIAKFVMMPQLLENPVVAAAESYFCMIAITVVTLALRLTLLQAMATCVGGGVLGLAASYVGSHDGIDWRGLSYYFFAMASVCLFVCWLYEEKEKVAFLQALLLVSDAREKAALNRELNRLAHQDALSGLANRREFDRRLALEWERLKRERKPLALLFIDVDHFKAYNDHYGHAAGDDALMAVGKAISDALMRPADLAARYGGEEFVILLPDTDRAGAQDVAQRVLAAVDLMTIPHAASDTAPHITVSVGVASSAPAPDTSHEHLLRHADAALYAVKQTGRRGIAVAGPDGNAVRIQ